MDKLQYVPSGLQPFALLLQVVSASQQATYPWILRQIQYRRYGEAEHRHRYLALYMCMHLEFEEGPIG